MEKKMKLVDHMPNFLLVDITNQPKILVSETQFCVMAAQLSLSLIHKL